MHSAQILVDAVGGVVVVVVVVAAAAAENVAAFLPFLLLWLMVFYTVPLVCSCIVILRFKYVLKP